MALIMFYLGFSTFCGIVLVNENPRDDSGVILLVQFNTRVLFEDPGYPLVGNNDVILTTQSKQQHKADLTGNSFGCTVTS